LAKKTQSQMQSAKPKRSRLAFFRDVIDELRKVTWPTRREAMRLTIMVIIVCAVVGVFLGLVDYGFSELVARVFLGGR